MATEVIPLTLATTSGNRELDAYLRLLGDQLSVINAERTSAANAENDINLKDQIVNTLTVDIPEGSLLGWDSSGNLALADSSVPVDGVMIATELVGVQQDFIPVFSGIQYVLVENKVSVTVGALAYLTKDSTFAGTATPTAPTTADDLQQILGRWVSDTDSETGLARIAFFPQVYTVQV